jgi:uncharacterized protein YbaP (TraB family)
MRAQSILAAIAFAIAAHPAFAEPALWAAYTGDSTVYLFGTIHVLPKDAAWRSEKIDAAFAESRSLVLEAVELDDYQAVGPLMRELGTDPAHPLSTRISPADMARVRAAFGSLTSNAADDGAIDLLRPWAAVVTLDVLVALKAGLDPHSGADVVLKTEALSQSKRVDGLETISRQVHILADLPDDEQVAMLHDTLDEQDRGEDAASIDRLIAAWTAGDVSALEAIFMDTVGGPGSALEERLLAKRNEAWADRVVAMLGEPGVTFIAVGAAHLTGPDSLQSRLEKRGVHVERK